MASTALLIILDGFGLAEAGKGNAVSQAHTPHLDALFESCPWQSLDASEEMVGLPHGVMGNSEVGHLNLGSGRQMLQDLPLISQSIADGSFYENAVLLDLIKEVKKKKGATLHLMGLLSDGGVHSHIEHWMAAIMLCKKQGLTQVALHPFLDGRDTPPTSGLSYLEKLEDFCQSHHLGRVETLSGRFYAMDRDSRWERTALCFETLMGKGEGGLFDSATQALSLSYEKMVTDEFFKPQSRKGYQGIQEGDGVFFLNFRADRARQMAHALTQPSFEGFKRSQHVRLGRFVGMTEYESDLNLQVAFPKQALKKTLGEVVSLEGLSQLRIAETEKYAHVTYFFNGGAEEPFKGEERILIPSPRGVSTYDEKPEMSARELTDRLLEELGREKFSLVVVNYANCDMVGHTGNMQAAIKAVETVDECLGRLVGWIGKNEAFALLTADHGNCEKMVTEEGEPLTSHTTLPVPCLLIGAGKHRKLREGGKLCDVAPTLLELMEMKVPREMTGRSLLV